MPARSPSEPSSPALSTHALYTSTYAHIQPSRSNWLYYLRQAGGCLSADLRFCAPRARVPRLLAPIYGWFTEGFDTADLKDAKALFDELA